MFPLPDSPSPWSIGWGLASLLLMTLVARALEWVWWRPKRLERALRAQGLRGTPYRLFFGDSKESNRLDKEARAEPMASLSHDIAPRVAPLFYRSAKKHGKVSYVWIGPTPRVIITDPRLANEVLLNKFGHFRKPDFNPLTRALSTGLLNYEGEQWVKHRRILNPAFHMEKIKRMAPAFASCSAELLNRWEGLAGVQGTFEVDIWPQFQNFTGDVISRTAFGSSFLEARRIFQLQTEQAMLIMQAFQNVYFPGYRFLPTSMNRRLKKIDREIKTILKGIIEKREKGIKTGEASGDDLLGLLMESNRRQFEEHGDKKAGMTIDEVIAECRLFYFAGSETTSILLTWTLITLSMHPTWQSRAREEVLQVFGKSTPDPDGLSRLKIVTMILNEVLRLYPPAIFLTRKTCKSVKLGSVTYPPGVNLSLVLILIHHDPEIWGKDAVEFNPERFSEGISKASKDQFAFFAFSGGPRVCIGQSFAMMEAKMTLSMILQQFSFELSPAYVHAPHTVLTLHPQHGAPIRFHRL